MLKIEAQKAFIAFLIAELLKLYGGEGEEKLEPDVQTLTGPRAYGQGSIGAKGRRFTGRASNLYRRPGQDLPTIMVDGRPVALGNTARRRPLRPRRAPGFAFVPYIPPVEDDMPYQPALSLSMIERPVEVGISKLMPGFVGGPVAHLDLDMELYEETGEIRLIWIPDGYGFGLPENVIKLMKSRLFPGGSNPVPWEDNALIFTHYPQERPYCVGYDDTGVYIASWPHWDGLDPFNNYHGGSPPDISGTGFTPGYSIMERYHDLPTQQIGSIQPIPTGSVSLEWELLQDTNYMNAYAYRINSRNTISITDESGVSTPTREEYTNSYWDWNTVINVAPGIDFLTHPFTREGQGSEEEWRFVYGAFASNSATVTNRGTGNFSSQVGVYTRTGGAVGSIQAQVRYTGIDPETGEEYTTNWQSEGDVYLVPDRPNSVVQSETLWATRFSFTFDIAPPPDNDSGISSDYFIALTESRKREIIPYYDGWPWPPTPESRAEVARLNPYIYERTGKTLYPPEFAQPPNIPGKLANPTGPLGVESSILGLTWTSANYTFDAFYATTLDAAGSPVERLYAVVIYQDGSAQRVAVSVDGVQVGEWALLDFFPTSDGTLYFLDGAPWDGELWPSYHFCGNDWPYKNVGYLRPFRARLRSSQDKVGAMFAAGAADAPITLFLDSDDHDA